MMKPPVSLASQLKTSMFHASATMMMAKAMTNSCRIIRATGR